MYHCRPSTSLNTHKKDNKNKDGNGTADDDKTTPSKQPSRVKTYELEDEHTSVFLCRVVSLTLLSIFPGYSKVREHGISRFHLEVPISIDFVYYTYLIGRFGREIKIHKIQN